MGLIFLGRSICPICGQVLQKGEEITSLPAFCDASHELYEFSDAGYHRQCFEAWARRAEVENLITTSQKKYEHSKYFGEMLQLHGPPQYMEDAFVLVNDSFLLSDSKIIVFLKWNKGKLPDGTLLENIQGMTWMVKQYLRTTGSIETYEKIASEEANNIFQYILKPLTGNAKPLTGSFLKIKNGL